MKRWLVSLLLVAMTCSSAAHAADYVIGEGDVLDIYVWGVKELSVSVKVRPDGKITIPGLGDVKVSGFTPVAVQKLLGNDLKQLVRNPNVTVTVKEITNSKAYIFGGGVKSVAYDLTRSTTLLQLLCSIGDFKTADLKKAYILRNGKKIKSDFHTLFVGGDTSQDLVIESNDAIYIPYLKDQSVYVLGAVNNPKFIEFREGMTVMEAILEAGGFSKFAKQNETAVLRKEGGKEVILAFKAKDLMNEGDLTQNLRLKPNDYVIVKEGMF